MSAASPPCLAIVGPTGVGKSRVALALAERLAGEIVACDSVQVYRGFDIGSAKPTRAEQTRVPHHMVDVATWEAPFDAQQYVTQATECLARIRRRGRLPIVCGGTGLYLRCLRWGLMPSSGADPNLRAALYRDEEHEPGSLFARLRRLDPHTKVHPRNVVAVVRALELCLESGEAASSLKARHGFCTAAQPMCVVVLDAPDLRQSIEDRAKSMLDRGLLTEVEDLLSRGVDPRCRPMRAVGYREACHALAGALPRRDLPAAIERSTWQYARRQRTWMRRENGVHPVEATNLDETCAAVARLHARASQMT